MRRSDYWLVNLLSALIGLTIWQMIGDVQTDGITFWTILQVLWLAWAGHTVWQGDRIFFRDEG